MFKITKVEITNIKDKKNKRFERLQNAQIYIDDLFCGQLPEKTERGQVYTVNCNVVGRSVRFFKDKK